MALTDELYSLPKLDELMKRMAGEKTDMISRGSLVCGRHPVHGCSNVAT